MCALAGRLDRLLSNPHAQPPLPSDWEVRPTHPVRGVPYYLAPLWDAGLAAKSLARKDKGGRKGDRAWGGTTVATIGANGDMAGKGRVPRELREKLKYSRGAKGLLRDLEVEVRRFVERWEELDRQMVREGSLDPDSEDEEIVFVGRHGQMSDMPSPATERPQREKLLLDSALDDQGASFGYAFYHLLTVCGRDDWLTGRRRWLVHHIGNYYGLQTWSVTVGDPARREAYVGIKDVSMKSGRRVLPKGPLPQPLWVLV